MRTFVITGATTGIGGELARSVPEPGDRVVLQYHRNKSACRAVEAACRDRGMETLLVQADFAADPDGAARRVGDAVSQRTDQVSVLINNAGGILKRDVIGDASFDIVSGTINLNLVAPMMLASYLMPSLRRAADAGGRADVVNITSIAARTGSPTSTFYGAAKAGLENFTRGLAKEVGPAIRVNSVSPGVIETPFHDVTSQEQMDRWLAATPVRHHGRPEDIAAAVRFVLANEFMTGGLVPVNGGIQMI